MNKLLLAVFLIVMCYYAQACNDCPRPPPVVPVLCGWYGGVDCDQYFEDIITDSWHDAGPDFFFSSELAGDGAYGAWYNQVFNFYQYTYNSGSVIYPSFAALGLVATLF